MAIPSTTKKYIKPYFRKSLQKPSQTQRDTLWKRHTIMTISRGIIHGQNNSADRVKNSPLSSKSPLVWCFRATNSPWSQVAFPASEEPTSTPDQMTKYVIYNCPAETRGELILCSWQNAITSKNHLRSDAVMAGVWLLSALTFRWQGRNLV